MIGIALAVGSALRPLRSRRSVSTPRDSGRARSRVPCRGRTTPSGPARSPETPMEADSAQSRRAAVPAAAALRGSPRDVHRSGPVGNSGERPYTWGLDSAPRGCSGDQGGNCRSWGWTRGRTGRNATHIAAVQPDTSTTIRTIMKFPGTLPGLVNLAVLNAAPTMRLRPAAARATVLAPSTPHLLHRAARPEPDLDLDNLEIVQSQGAQNPGDPFDHPFHASRPAFAAGLPGSHPPAAAR